MIIMVLFGFLREISMGLARASTPLKAVTHINVGNNGYVDGYDAIAKIVCGHFKALRPIIDSYLAFQRTCG